MYDSYNRRIDYLRISVTDKCNLRCRYCMPEEGVPPRRHEEFLSHEQIVEVVRAAVGLGLTKIRLTGGEPLVKRGIVELAGMIRAVPGVRPPGHDHQRHAAGPLRRRAAARRAGQPERVPGHAGGGALPATSPAAAGSGRCWRASTPPGGRASP